MAFSPPRVPGGVNYPEGVLGHSNKMLCFWLSGFFNSDAGGRVIIIIMGGCGLRD